MLVREASHATGILLSIPTANDRPGSRHEREELAGSLKSARSSDAGRGSLPLPCFGRTVRFKQRPYLDWRIAVMFNLLRQLKRDEHGVILSSEIVIIGSLLVVGLITGATCLQQSVDAELRDFGNAIGALDQSYSFSSHRKNGFCGHCCAWTAGSSFMNCETGDNRCGDIVGCLVVASTACSVCGDDACRGCSTTATCETCGGTDCGSRCLNTDVPGLRVSEWSGPGCPTGPVIDPLFQQLSDGQCDDCETPCPVVATPTIPPCVNSGDIVIPDYVW
jgi:Flp pilus assembly pilin Flp